VAGMERCANRPLVKGTAAFPSSDPDLSRRGSSGVPPQCLRRRQRHELRGQNCVVNLASRFDFVGRVRPRSSWALDDPCGINGAVPAELSRLTRAGPFAYDGGHRSGHRIQRATYPPAPRRYPSPRTAWHARAPTSTGSVSTSPRPATCSACSSWRRPFTPPAPTRTPTSPTTSSASRCGSRGSVTRPPWSCCSCPRSCWRCAPPTARCRARTARRSCPTGTYEAPTAGTPCPGRKLAARGDGSLSANTRKRTAKLARHCFRLLSQGAQLLATGDMSVRVENPAEYLPFDDMPVPDILARFEQADARFRATPSVPPESADLATVERVPLTIRDRHYRAAA
jgi:hypothetical protein